MPDQSLPDEQKGPDESSAARPRRAEQARAMDLASVPKPSEPPTVEYLDETAEASESAAGQGSDPPKTTRRRTLQSLIRPGRGQVIAAVILLVVGMGSVMQIKINNADDTYSTARREDLIQLLDGLGQESRRLEAELTELERARTNLISGADTQRVAREEAQKRIEVLSILAGTVPAEGAGIRLTITDTNSKIKADLLLDAIEEMRDAGAEVIEFNDSVRVVSSTWFSDSNAGLVIGGQSISSPIVLEAIGDPHSLEEAARFRGGIVSEITGPRVGGQVQIEQLDNVVVDSLHTQRQNQYAQPASPPPTPR